MPRPSKTSRDSAVDLFNEQIRLFSRNFDTSKISLEIRSKHFDKNCAARDVAWAEISKDRCVVCLTSKLLSMPEENIIAVIRHEIAHCVDPALDRAGAEQRADDIAFLACGDRICYDKNLVQTIGKGIHPRPKHLRR